MKTVVKKSLTKTQKLAIILSSALVLLIAASVVLTIVYANLNKNDPTKTPPDIREELGETLYANNPIAYERIEEGQIQALVVTNEYGRFDLTRWPDANGDFWLGYDDGSGNAVTYIPPITSAEGGFDYESLYAIENNDGYGRFYMLSYLCSAVGTVYFDERIDLPEDKGERDKLLAGYGLAGAEAKPTVVSFAYAVLGEDKKPTGEIKNHHVTIGDPALNGDGFYFRIDGRNCVYYAKNSSFKYAKLGFNEFVKGTLIAAGLAGDKSFEPLLTTEFTEIKNTLHKEGPVEDGSAVISVGNVLKPIKEGSTYTPDKYPTGYDRDESKELKFDLSELGEHPDFDRIAAALIGREVGKQSGLYITLIDELYGESDSVIAFGDAAGLTYRYVITDIESIVEGADSVENATPGTVVGADAKLIRVSYSYSIDGVLQNTVLCHAVLDLNDPLLPDSAEQALRAACVGELDSAVTFDITYTKENVTKSIEKFVVSNIVGIYNSAGIAQEKVKADSYVAIRYYTEIDGNKSEKEYRIVMMPELKDSKEFPGLYELLLDKESDKSVDKTSDDDRGFVLYTKEHYHEVMRGFTTYEITDINGYLTGEEIVSFRFVNESVRDPFYGESVYENLTEKYKLYGVDADVCQRVLTLLGGLGEDTTTSLGLSGKTVAVGLTHEVMLDYGLYAYTVHFELPRGIRTETIKPEDGGESIEDYYHDDTLRHTLYVSLPDPSTGKRYVGSELYDVVAEVDASVLEFLECSFIDFWARRSMIMLELSNVDRFKIDFLMDDVKGSYDFDIIKELVYVDPDTGEVSYSSHEGWTEQDYFTVYTTESGDFMTDTELHKFVERHSIDDGRVALHALYNEVMGGGEDLLLPGSVEWVGVSNFMLAFEVMQLTSYQNSLTEEEQAKANDDNRLMRITLGLNSDLSDYVYEFYRISDRKVMVKTYKINSLGQVLDGTEVSELCISTFAFKKMVNAYLTVLNAGAVDREAPYVD